MVLGFRCLQAAPWKFFNFRGREILARIVLPEQGPPMIKMTIMLGKSGLGMLLLECSDILQ